jgi:hypothetical protein
VKRESQGDKWGMRQCGECENVGSDARGLKIFSRYRVSD